MSLSGPLSNRIVCLLLPFFLTATLFFSPGSVDAAQEIPLEDPSLRLELDAETGSISSWKVLDAVHDKILLDLAASGQQLTLEGEIAGKSLEEWLGLAKGWKIDSPGEKTWSFVLEGEDIPFILEKRWQILGDIPWHANLMISVAAKNDFPQPELGLRMGPGIGDQPISGLGMADSLYSYTELVYKDTEGVQALRFEKPGEKKKINTGSIQWIGLHSRYFALLLLPQNQGGEQKRDAVASTPESPDLFPTSPGFETNIFIPLSFTDMKKGETQTLTWGVFGGGKSYNALNENGLSDLLYNSLWQWMRWLVVGIGFILYNIQIFVSNWGISIILLALVVRIIIHPLARWAMRAQKEFAAIQKIIQPELREIKRLYKGGEQSERILQLYEKHKVSPLAGLKPLLVVAIQIPVFVALFHLLGQTFELKDTSFLWMKTLSEPDQLFAFGFDVPFFGSYFNLLPLLMSLTNLLTIGLTPSPTKTEGGWFKRNFSMIIMALAFFLLFYSFPSGMVLYWTTANVLQLVYTYLSNLKPGAALNQTPGTN